jgi:hypothetical protein
MVELQGLDASGLERADEAWRPLDVASAGGDRFAGWWRIGDGFVWTVVG